MSTIEFTEAELAANELRIRRSRIAWCEGPHESADDMARAVAKYWALTQEELLGPRRSPLHCEARSDLYARLRAQGWSYPQIGRYVNRDHTTVMNALHAKKQSRR